MDDDSHILLYLEPQNEFSTRIIATKENDAFYVPSEPVVWAEQDAEREHTPLSAADDEFVKFNPAAIRLTFQHTPKNIARGFTFGHNHKLCDIFLPLASVSSQHFSITFDEDKRLVLRDTSTHGISFSIKGQGSDHPRHHFTWMLEPGFVIELRIGLQCPLVFKLSVPEHKSCMIAYQRKVSEFVEAQRKVEPSLKFLDLYDRQTSRAPTGTQSPSRRPWYLVMHDLGQGQFGKVDRVQDISTGAQYAMKRFRKGCSWEKEVDVLKKLHHDHIIRYVDDIRDSEIPALIMEYAPFGSLENLTDISMLEVAHIVLQTLDGLAEIHHCGWAHRDIKPANILIHSRQHNARGIHIKIADFGLTQDHTALKTHCGTSQYIAPEIGLPATFGYTHAVDIWSLGVVALEFAYGLPSFSPDGIDTWHRSIIAKAKDTEDDILIDLLRDCMLILEDTKRLTAKECLERARIMPLETLQLQITGRAPPLLAWSTSTDRYRTIRISTDEIESRYIQTKKQAHCPKREGDQSVKPITLNGELTPRPGRVLRPSTMRQRLHQLPIKERKTRCLNV